MKRAGKLTYFSQPTALLTRLHEMLMDEKKQM